MTGPVSETLLTSAPHAPWLPAGGRADVVRASVAPAPTGLVRLLVRRGDTVFCTRRDDGRIDLPTRAVPGEDPDGSATVAALTREVLGAGVRPAPVGYVRNVVPEGVDGYPWPVPLAHFVVWAASGDPRCDGTWEDVRGASTLRDRHWWPLLGADPA